jgi:hypothetical protein
MARIVVADAQAWLDGTKLTLSALEPALLQQVESQVVSSLDSSFDVTTWVDDTNTPAIVKTIIAMNYVAWLYDRQYSEDQEQGNDYAALLRAQSASLQQGLIDGSIVIPGQSPDTGPSDTPLFFPTDESSSLSPTDLQPELGGSSFTMRGIF